MKSLIPVFLLTLLMTASPAAQDLKYLGDEIFEVKSIREFLSRLAGVDKAEEKLRTFLQDQAARQGYFDAQVEVNLSEDSTIAILTSSGPRYRLSGFILESAGIALPLLENELDEKFRRCHASSANLNAILELSVDYFAERGYPFAQSQIISLEKSFPESCLIRLKITSGPMVLIDSVRFISDKKVSAAFLRRKAGISLGRPFRQTMIDNSLKRLQALDYLRVEGMPEESYDNDFRSCLLSYNIKQGMPNQIEGALGYNPQTAARSAFLFGFLDLSISNPFGDGKCFFLHWDKPGETSSRLSLALDYPFPWGSPFEIRPHLAQEKYSDLYLSLSVGLELSLDFQAAGRFTGGFGWEKITAQGKIFSSVYNSRVYSASVRLEFSGSLPERPRPYSRGLGLGVAYLHKRLYPTLGVSPQRNSLDPIRADIGVNYGSIFDQGLFWGLQSFFSGYTENENLISPSEMIKLGGRKTLRGYSEEQFLTPRAFWARVESGLVSNDIFKAYLFTDFGYARLTSLYASGASPNFENRFLFGAGMGLGLFSERTGVDVSLAWSKDDSLGEGKLYLVLDNRF